MNAGKSPRPAIQYETELFAGQRGCQNDKDDSYRKPRVSKSKDIRAGKINKKREIRLPPKAGA